MNFDLVPIPFDDFSVKAQDVAINYDTATPKLLKECPGEDESLLKFGPFIGDDGGEAFDISEDKVKKSSNFSNISDDGDNSEAVQEKDDIVVTINSAIHMKEAPSSTELHGECMGDGADNDDLNRILFSIHPPQEYATDDKHFIRNVSKQPAFASDAVELHHRLDKLLEERRALTSGVCPIRRGLYEDCLNELIRQIALSPESTERARLLLNLREEIKKTETAYQYLFQSTVSFCTFKECRRIVAQHQDFHTTDLARKEMQDLEKEYSDLQETIRKNTTEYGKELEKTTWKYKDEIDYLKVQHFRLQKQIGDFAAGRGFMEKPPADKVSVGPEVKGSVAVVPSRSYHKSITFKTSKENK